MTGRPGNLIACFAGCLIGSLVGLIIMLKFDAPFLAAISAAIFPTLACRWAGITNRKQLVKIAVYSGVAWILTFMLQPVVARSEAQRIQRILELPLLGNDWHVPAAAVSTLMALVGVYFIPVGHQ